MFNKVEPANTVTAIENGCFVSGALATVLRVSRYLGTASLRFAKKRDGWRITLCPGLSLFSALVITITGIWNMAINFSDKLYSIQEKDSEWSTVQHAVRLVESFLVSLMAMWMVYNGPAHMQHITQCLNQLQKVHLELKINYWPKQQKKHVALVMLWLIIWMISSSCDYFVVAVFNNESPLWIKIGEFLYYVHYAVIHVRVLQFVLIVVHVHFNFRTINNYLRSYLRDAENKKPKEDSQLLGRNSGGKSNQVYFTRLNNYIDSFEGGKIGSENFKVEESKKPKKDSLLLEKNYGGKSNQVYVTRLNNYIDLFGGGKTGRENFTDIDKKPSALSDFFHTLCNAYGATCYVMRTVNHAEGMMLMLMLVFLFNSFMSTFYFFITNVVYNESELGEGFFIFYGILLFIWTCVHLFNLLLIIEPCHLTHLEMQTTRKLVSRLMRCTDSAHDLLEIELDQLYKTVTINEVYYKPLNVILMCRSLVIKILGSVTTYLVVIIKIK